MMLRMNTTFAIESFPLVGSAVHVPPAGHALLLQGEALTAHPQHLPEGYLLGVFEVSVSADVHPDMWEMHPAGDEVLVMLSGELEVEYSDELHRDTSSLEAGHGMLMPTGVWHRLRLREPGRLLVLSPPQGTRLSRDAGGRP